MLVQRLKAIQDQYGYLPDDSLRRLAAETGTPLYRLQELASFFPHFRQEWNKPPDVLIQVCRDMACHLRGSRQLVERLKGLEQQENPSVRVETVSCLGRCDRAPALCVSRQTGPNPFHDHIYAGRTQFDFESTLKKLISGKPSQPDSDAKYFIDRSTWQIDPYARPGEYDPYEAVKILLTATSPIPPSTAAKPHPWLEKLNVAGLLGMGGAGVPAYRKWLDVWKAQPADGSAEKYVICNGDESEPSTFKDREILLHLPHLVVEGVILAGLLTHATAGYIFIRHEYTEQIAAVRKAIAKAESVGACGRDIFGTGKSFPVEVFVSPGGYICGEQSALIEVMEDKRAQPRNKPPELSTNGFRDRPTLVNNVETLAWVPAIMLRGGEWYATAGATGFRGRRLFSICGDVARPGVFEVPVGITLGELIALAGGMREGRELKAAALSGPSGGLLPAHMPILPGAEQRAQHALEEINDKALKQCMTELVAKLFPPGATALDIRELPLDKAAFGTLSLVLGADLMLGAGLAVFGTGTDLLALAVRMTEFFRNESCGKCVPCRIGSQKLVDIGQALLDRRAAGKRLPLEIILDDVLEMNKVLSVTSICGLGQVAGNPMATALAYFAEEIAQRGGQ